MVNTGVTYLIYLLFILFLPYAAAYTVTYIAGIFISYFLNSVFVFRARLSIKALLQFPLIYLVQYLLGLGTVFACVEWLKISKLIAPLVAVAVTIPVTFVLSRTLLKKYKRPNDRQDRK